MTIWPFKVSAPLDPATAQQLAENDLDNDRAQCPHCGAVRGRDCPDGCMDPFCPGPMAMAIS